MARFLILWRVNPVAPWPTDPSEHLKLDERMYAAIDDLIKKGEIEDFGFFLEGNSGYAIGKGESTDLFRSVSMFQPYIIFEIHDIIPYEKERKSQQHS
ncbi:MAG: hypothetical protein ACE5OW_02930 [Candidatus Bathyarchaeia archaeon]